MARDEILEAISNVTSKMEERYRGVIANINPIPQQSTSSIEPANMTTDLTTVVNLLKEWTVGLDQSKPSVNYLNENYGCRWRQEGKAEEKCISLEEAAQAVENERISIRGCSLDKLLDKRNWVTPDSE
ncbi:hypothetical protein EDC94DRAFT_693398 [Helicostylum pulchrum]|nr:hypothetical protein EDC94DRAFT_693398 [Helicostylum pulchrum]